MTIFANIQRNSLCNSTRNNVAEQRLRMRDWLELRIGDPRYPGLVWVNNNQKIFRIPWKHGARHGWRPEEDARLFRDWSEHTGACPRDIKQHKANFRCALNSLRDIRKLTNLNKSKGDDAYRVYQILPKSQCKSNKRWIRKRKVCKRDNLNYETENSKFTRSRIAARKLSVQFPYNEHFHFPKCEVKSSLNYDPICSSANPDLPDTFSTGPYFQCHLPGDSHAQHNFSYNSTDNYNETYQRNTFQYQTPPNGNEERQPCDLTVAKHLSEAVSTGMREPGHFITENHDYGRYNNNSFQLHSYVQSPENHHENMSSVPMTPPAESYLFPNDYNCMSDDSDKNIQAINQPYFDTHNFGAMEPEVKPFVAFANGENFPINDLKTESADYMKNNAQNVLYKSHNQDAYELRTSPLTCFSKTFDFDEHFHVKRESVTCLPSTSDSETSFQTNSSEDLSVQYLHSSDKVINANHSDVQSFDYDTITPSPTFCEMDSYNSYENLTKTLPSASTLLNLSNRLLSNSSNKCIPTKMPFSVSHAMSPAVVYGQ